MANFAVSASEEIIAQGNALIEEMKLPGELKGETLKRIFDKASEDLDGAKLKQSGIDVIALDASLANIRSMLLTAVSGKEQIIAGKDAEISDIKERKDQLDKELRAKIADLVEEKTVAEQTAASAAQAAAQAIKDEETAREQADTATKLAEEKDKTISTLADKLAIAEEKATGYDDLKKSEEQAQATIAGLKKDIETLNAENVKKLDAAKTDTKRTIEDLKKEHIREIDALNKDHETAIRELNTEMERKVSDAKKDAALSLAQAVAEKEHEMMGQIREADKENARLQAKIEVLEARLNELTAAKN